MDGFLLGMVAGGALIFVCPGVGTFGNAWFKRARNFFRNL